MCMSRADIGILFGLEMAVAACSCSKQVSAKGGDQKCYVIPAGAQREVKTPGRTLRVLFRGRRVGSWRAFVLGFELVTEDHERGLCRFLSRLIGSLPGCTVGTVSLIVDYASLAAEEIGD